VKENDNRQRLKTIMDREKLMQHNAEGCPACGHKFTLGESVVLACDAWDGPAKLIHENEAVFDPNTNGYVDRKCWEAKPVNQ
jgi:hypothetical protein